MFLYILLNTYYFEEHIKLELQRKDSEVEGYIVNIDKVVIVFKVITQSVCDYTEFTNVV